MSVDRVLPGIWSGARAVLFWRVGQQYWRPIAACAAMLAVLATTWQFWPGSAGAAAYVAPQQVLAGQTLRADFCHQPASEPFVPTSITIPGITQRARVLALPRDANNIPSPLPLTEAGKHEFAWDQQPSPMPGADAGNVLLNAHTWPWFSTPAMGNLMLDNLRAGDRIVVRGADAHQCYEVTRQVEIRADQAYPAYYLTDGAPQLAIMVCSGTRVGPGDWDHRMIWFASPLES